MPPPYRPTPQPGPSPPCASELARADSKASLLLALTGAAFAAVASVGAVSRLPLAAVLVGTLALAALLAATVVLLATVRPFLAGPGWPTWPSLADEELTARLLTGHPLPEVRTLAALARRKYTRVRIAVDLITTGVILTATATALATVHA